MSDLNFDPPENHGIDNSERTDPDSGGGMNFVFYDQGRGRRQGGSPEDKQKKRRQTDFGDPVKVSLSSQDDVEEPEADDSEEEFIPPVASIPPAAGRAAAFNALFASTNDVAPRSATPLATDSETITDDPVRVSISAKNADVDDNVKVVDAEVVDEDADSSAASENRDAIPDATHHRINITI